MKKESQFKEIIHSTLINNKTLPSEVINGYWGTAKAWKDEAILSDLIRRDDLPAPLIEEAKKFTSIALRASYLLRSTINESEFYELTSNENRAGVLAAVVDELDIKKFSAFNQILLASLIKKPTRRLAEAVITSETANKELYLQALLSVTGDAGTSDFERSLNQRVSAIAQDEELYARLLKESDNSTRITRWASYALTNKGISASNRLLALEIIVPSMLFELSNHKQQGASNLQRRVGHVLNTVQNILTLEDIQPEIILAVRSYLLAYELIKEDLEPVISALDPVALAQKEADRKELIANIKSTTSMDFIITSATEKSRRDTDEELVFIALTNPNLDVNTELEVLRAALNINGDKAFAYVKENPSDLKALEVYKNTSGSIIKEDNYSLFSDPTIGRTLCITDGSTFDSNDYRSQYSRWNLIEAVVEEMPELDSSLGSVPWEYLVERSSNWYRERPATKKIISYLVKLQTEVLGSDPRKWETFNIISQDFTGSISDLVSAASTI